MGEYEEIIIKARELSEMIERSPITVKYRESLEKMKNDAGAQRILAELVRLGGEITHTSGTEDSGGAGKAELEMLREEFERNSLVKDHILAQKEYLNLIKSVQERIRNPIG